MCATSAVTGSASSMVSRVARVAAREVLEGSCHRIELQVAGPWPESGPGQFAMLALDHPAFPILPRPFSLLGWRDRPGGDRIEFMIMPVGTGSRMLCALQEGDAVQVVGPLGGRMDAHLPAGPLVFVAGGYGVAPFLFLCEQWQRDGDERVRDVTVIYGARSAEKLALNRRLRQAAGRLELCTDDGSAGFHGRVDARLEAWLDEHEPALVVSCGPEAMMKAVGRTCGKRGVPARASLETVMGCGYSVCNGCAVAVVDESEPDGFTYRLACRDGTVFGEDQILWNRS